METINTSNNHSNGYLPALKEFIIENFLFGDGEHLKEDTSFFEKGIIDSAGIMELVSFVEDTYNVKIEDNELIPENFSSLEQVDRFLQEKLKLKVA